MKIIKRSIGLIALWLLIQRYNMKHILREVLSCFWLFIIVFIFMSSEIWIPYTIGFITQNKWWFGIGSACWLFWLGPGTPFIPLCIVITLSIKKLFHR